MFLSIKNGLTLMHMPRLMRESTLNKIGAFNLNPRLKLILGQKANHLDFRAIMDEGKILLLDLGRSDGETNRLIGSLVVTGLEMAMRRRRNRRLWNLTIDEFAGYVANEGSVKTLRAKSKLGYGLAMRPESNDLLAGLLMVDRPQPADPQWLAEVEAAFGECRLVAMTPAGERGIACQMQIEPDSLPHLRRFPGEKTAAIQTALKPLLENPPKPVFTLRWDEEARLWCSRFAPLAELPGQIREVFERTGYGCLAAEANVGVVHVCHAADRDVDGFAGKPVLYRWQLIEMSTAPLIRLEVAILDRPANPYRFESFLNVAQEDQAQVLAELAHQDRLYLAFYGDDLTHRFTRVVDHDEQQWQYLDELVAEAVAHWDRVPPEQRDLPGQSGVSEPVWYLGMI